LSAGFDVLIIDMAHYDTSENYVVRGFPTFELAREYARRRVRDSVEELRAANQSKEELRRLWHVFGEDATVIGGETRYAGSHELDFFISHPATVEERDWKSVERLANIR
jgi:hypothetical protein